MASGQGKDAGHWLDGLSGGESPPPFFHLISCEVLGPRSREVRAEFIRPLDDGLWEWSTHRKVFSYGVGNHASARRLDAAGLVKQIYDGSADVEEGYAERIEGLRRYAYVYGYEDLFEMTERYVRDPYEEVFCPPPVLRIDGLGAYPRPHGNSVRLFLAIETEAGPGIISIPGPGEDSASYTLGRDPTGDAYWWHRPLSAEHRQEIERRAGGISPDTAQLNMN
jgi:hypothetical protein